MDFDCDAIVIGAGVAGTAVAILLAQAGWRVAVVEQHAYPRRKVCGECIGAGSLSLLDDLGVGPAFRGAAGPELRRVGWMDAATTVSADMPSCSSGRYAYGRALGRDRLDSLLLQRARALGVLVIQPARVVGISGAAGCMACAVKPSGAAGATGRAGAAGTSNAVAWDGDARTLRAPVLVDAHGSWERGPAHCAQPAVNARVPKRDSDLFAFKANFRNARLAAGFLPVLAFPGGYGGMVQGDDGRTTLACCLRRDTLAAVRARGGGIGAGVAVEGLLLRSCAGVRAALEGADREGAWLTVGPLRPGIRVDAFHGAFRVGNAAGESHPLIGEGISMALEGAALLTSILLQQPAAAIAGTRAFEVHRRYAAAWRRAFAPRLKVAAVYAHIAMRPPLATAAREFLRRWPSLLYRGARLAGKATRASGSPSRTAEIA